MSLSPKFISQLGQDSSLHHEWILLFFQVAFTNAAVKNRLNEKSKAWAVFIPTLFQEILNARNENEAYWSELIKSVICILDSKSKGLHMLIPIQVCFEGLFRRIVLCIETLLKKPGFATETEDMVTQDFSHVMYIMLHLVPWPSTKLVSTFANHVGQLIRDLPKLLQDYKQGMDSKPSASLIMILQHSLLLLDTFSENQLIETEKLGLLNCCFSHSVNYDSAKLACRFKLWKLDNVLNMMLQTGPVSSTTFMEKLLQLHEQTNDQHSKMAVQFTVKTLILNVFFSITQGLGLVNTIQASKLVAQRCTKVSPRYFLVNVEHETNFQC
jgi:hypothetical protein